MSDTTTTTDTMDLNKNYMFNLNDNPENRYTFLPILNRKYYDHYKSQMAVFWTAEELDLSSDKKDYWEKLTDTERLFVKNILSFFSASDGIVAENLDINFNEEIQFKEVGVLLRFQGMMEDIHSEVYSLLIDAILIDKKEKEDALDAINKMPVIKLKSDWALKWTDRSKNCLAKRLIAFCLVEGLQFSGAFSSICWLSQRNIMPGLINANEFIRRDENSHVQTSIMLYNDLKEEYRLSEEVVYEIVTEALDIEKEFMTKSIPCSMLGMNEDLMCQYLEYVADQLLVQLNYNKKWNTKNPFDFMVNLSIENKTNFFEHRVSEYNKSGVGVSAEERQLTFDDDDDF
jgi:ribonucleoside-diphosphate reductase beta chain